MANKKILITGAARRIGAATARLLHKHGCNVILHYHQSVEQALSLCAELNQLRNDSALALQADLCNQQAVLTLAQQAQAQWQGLDVLINNAAQFYPGNIGNVDEAAWDNMINSNLKAPFFLSQALAPILLAHSGCIINIADIYAEKGLPGYPVYSIAKAGLVAMTKCLAKELAPAVRVNAVAPGAILWPENALEDADKNNILDRVALGRCGQADDIAKAVWFLINDADYVTGHILTVDGGRTLSV